MKKKKEDVIEYIQNAKEILKKSRIEEDEYVDLKYVKSACGVLYLGILKAIDEFLLKKKNFTEKELPQSFQGYLRVLKKYLSPFNGKIEKKFISLYRQLHIAGYYRGLITNRNVLKIIFKESEGFIRKIKNLSS